MRGAGNGTSIGAWALTDRGSSTAVGYLTVQAVLGILWWASLFRVPTVRAWFELMPDRRSGLDAFLLADAVVFVGGSLAAALTTWRRSPWAGTVAALTAGGVVYATLYLAGWVVLEGSAAMGLAPMGIATMATTAIALGTRGPARDDG